jgi:hypothetical protein
MLTKQRSHPLVFCCFSRLSWYSAPWPILELPGVLNDTTWFRPLAAVAPWIIDFLFSWRAVSFKIERVIAERARGALEIRDLIVEREQESNWEQRDRFGPYEL